MASYRVVLGGVQGSVGNDYRAYPPLNPPPGIKLFWVLFQLNCRFSGAKALKFLMKWKAQNTGEELLL